MQDTLSQSIADPTTERLAEFITTIRREDLSDKARTLATHALLDWCGVTLAAFDDPAVKILVDELCDPADEATGVTATLLGQKRKGRLLDATMINGTAGHALDYDDVNPRLGGHPSVPTIPVALALGEVIDASGPDVLTAIVCGFEVECAIGMMSGTSHYAKGFHNTATVGTFGAAATAARLLDLSIDQTRIALGLAATMAAGLKCNFGTMTKPLHGGTAAANGLRAARLAARGFTAATNALEAPQGFAATQVPAFDPHAWTSPLSVKLDAREFAISQTLFKYHAACYGAHAAIEAARALRQNHEICLEDVEKIRLQVPDRARGQCDQAEPSSGLGVKFSLQHLVVAVLDQVDTAALGTYSVETATDPRYVAARRRVELCYEPDWDRYDSEITVMLRDGSTFNARGGVGVPMSDLDAQWAKLHAKFVALAAPVIGQQKTSSAAEQIRTLETASSVVSLARLLS